MRNSKNKSLKRAQIASFEDEVAVNIGPLTHYIACHVKKAADVEGRVQDTLEAAFQAYPGFNGDSSVSTWLIGIAKHQIAHYYRKTPNNVDNLSYDDDIANSDAFLKDDCYRQLKHREIQEVISTLPNRYQRVLRLHAVDGLNHAKIGRKLGISENATNSLISRARALLRKKVKINRKVLLKNGTK